MPRASQRLATQARAKVNLSLRVTGRRADGYHELHSLVAFAGVGDSLSLTPGPQLGLEIEGPFAAQLGGDDNLILKAVRLLAQQRPGLRTGRFTLVKRLPIASGIGGGSADAAAALRLVARLNGLALDDPALMAAARATGADVPVCLASRPRIMTGVGEHLGLPLRLPPMPAVLVNPGVEVATVEVFRALELPGEPPSATPPPRETPALIRWLADHGNDLETPALRLAPVIGEVLAALAGAPGCRLARMSGSGATCFGLFESREAAADVTTSWAGTHKNWWVRPTILR